MGQIFGMFSAVGGGLAVAVLLFLWATDFFQPTTELGDLGRAFAGALSLAAVLIFAMLIGVVLAAFGGLIAARASVSRTRTIQIAAIGAVLGHLGLVVVMGLFLRVGIGLFSQDEPQVPVASETRSSEEIADCVEIFGEDAEFCQPDEVGVELPSEEPVTLEAIARLFVGLLPAGLVGALSGAVLFRKSSAL